LDRVLLDTGSDSSIFATDELAALGLVPEPGDRLRRIAGIGGREYVLTKRVEKLTVGPMEMPGFDIQMGAMQYGFPIQGVLGMDFLLKTAAIIDLGELEVSWRGEETSSPS
jgi:hypothetical protein